MDRKITNILNTWREHYPGRLPLLIDGARQVGKTFAVQQFGKSTFDQTIILNFEENPLLIDLFQLELTPDKLIPRIEAFFGVRISPANTLLFFDEIQKCERAITSLKYFSEQAPHYNVIGAGSLLGISINRKQSSFPVGKVQIVPMRPLDMEEFLWAVGERYLADQIREHADLLKPISDTAHHKALLMYKEYLITGGMPASVVRHINPDGPGLGEAEIRKLILDSYIADMAKYTESVQAVRLVASFESIPAQLARDNKKFQYKLIQKGARSALFGESIDWLAQSGVILKCDRAEQGMMPLHAHVDHSSFKLYMSDVGLLSQKLQVSLAGLNDLGIFKGALAENYVAQTICANGYDLIYWADSIYEVDFLLIKESKVIPVEVKAGEHVKSPSLAKFQKLYSPGEIVKISGKNFGYANGIISTPLYAAFCL